MPYTPEHDRLTDVATLRAFVGDHPLAHLVTHDGTAPDVDLVPLLVVDSDTAPSGLSLIGHVARANRLWRPGVVQGPVMATFGPAHHYISPSWYPSKAEHHRAVPTWNYLVAHAWGELIVHDDAKWVRAAVARLTTRMEATQEQPWRMGMAPADYLQAMLENIVGIEIEIDRFEGRFKVSSHRSEADRLGARDGLMAMNDGAFVSQLAAAMSNVPPEQVRDQGR